ncbi:MAG: L-rhamnose mutarotase [Proteobacteria bacterium]|nr:L-rhamnose mutarotase [Pseudomonadota bacterium]
MEKVAFKMKLNSGQIEEYKKRHDEIWPELSQLLSDAGVYDYTIFIDEETNVLFAVQRLKEGHTAADLPQNELVKKWWKYMSDIMESNPDHSPVVGELKSVFHMD